MNATIFRTPAVRYSDSKNGALLICIDDCGPHLRFEYDGGESVLTTDDAMFAADMFSTPGVKIADEMSSACDAFNAKEIVFEAGAHIPYEGLYDAKLFRKYSDAVAHAEAVTDEWVTPEVYARKVS